MGIVKKITISQYINYLKSGIRLYTYSVVVILHIFDSIALLKNHYFLKKNENFKRKRDYIL